MHYEMTTIREGEGIRVVSCEASDEAEAIHQMRSQGYAVLVVRKERSWRYWIQSRRSHFPLTLFSQELLALLDAGLTLVEAFEALAEKEHRPPIQKILRRIIATLYEGHPLSYALQQFPNHFPVLYVATVRASEHTGDLGVALNRYVSYQMQMDVVRKKILSASIYPLFLLGAGGIVTLFLIGYVVPRFSIVYDQMGKNIPQMSRLLLAFGNLLRTHELPILAALVLVAVGIAYIVSSPASKEWMVRKLWQFPAVGNRLKIYQLARFFRTIGMLLNGGTPIVAALKMSSDLLHSSLRKQMASASNSIQEGLSISRAMELHGLTTPVASRMLAVGERSGKMGEMMERIATFYDDEMSRWVEWFSRLFEPILMAFIGLVIGGIVVLMYFPIFELAGSIQ